MADLLLLTSDYMVTGDSLDRFVIETSEKHMHYSLIRVTFTGEFRELDPERKMVVQAWSDVFAPERKELFQQEVLVTESGVDYWLPIQNALVPIMKNEVAVGGEMDAVIIFIGGKILTEEKIDHVFLLNGFRQVIPPSYGRVVYTGEFRELDPTIKLLIHGWLEIFMPLIDVQQEVLVTIDGVDYWMAIPESLIPSLKDEVDVGDEMDVVMFPITIMFEITSEEEMKFYFLLREFSPVTP